MRPHPVSIAAAVLVALEALAIGVLAVIQVGEILAGHSAEAATGIALLVLTIVMGVGVAAFAFGILREKTWGRSGGIVTQILILSIALGAATGTLYDHPLLGAVIAVPGILGLVLIVASSRKRPEQRVPRDDAADDA